ncbi:MAG: hypothetical protein L0I76_26240 [Pseudonocardia sp.]|nr:hypothetical protein [Pseudonocardia sp.]
MTTPGADRVAAALECLVVAEAAVAEAHDALTSAVSAVADEAYESRSPRVIVAALRDLYWHCTRVPLKDIMGVFGIPTTCLSMISSLVGPFEDAERPCWTCGCPMSFRSRTEIAAYDRSPRPRRATLREETVCESCFPRPPKNNEPGRKQVTMAMLWAELERRDLVRTQCDSLPVAALGQVE